MFFFLDLQSSDFSYFLFFLPDALLHETIRVLCSEGGQC